MHERTDVNGKSLNSIGNLKDFTGYLKSGYDSFPLKQSADQIRRNFFPPTHNSFCHHSHLGCTWFFRKQPSAGILQIIYS